MADDFDIEAMLEAPYRKDEIKHSSPNGHEERSKKKKKSRSRSRDRKRSKSRDRKKSHDHKRSRSRERKLSRSRERRRSRTRSRERSGRYRDHKTTLYIMSSVNEGRESRLSITSAQLGTDQCLSPILEGGSEAGVPGATVCCSADKTLGGRLPLEQRGCSFSEMREPQGAEMGLGPIDNLTPEERDARTVFCMQLAARIRPRDLEEFFSAVGKVRDVRMISDRNSRRSKGIAYIEFVEANSVPLAIGLSGQRLLGVPIIVQASQAEKNRAAAMANNLQKGNAGPMRLYVGSLHFNITEEMLRGIFEPFGKALDQLNGFELAGRPMKVGHVTERTDASTASSFLDSDELERTGIDLGTTGRLQLMARLAEGTGLQIPPAAQQALQMSGAIAIGAMAAVSAAMNPAMNMNNMNRNTAMNLPSQPLATHCFQLSNMFNPQSEDDPGWDADIQHDVIEECNKHGGVVHIYVDKNSTEGNVYVKCPTIPAAMAAVNALHGRYFAGPILLLDSQHSPAIPQVGHMQVISIHVDDTCCAPRQSHPKRGEVGEGVPKVHLGLK
ncbi:unnamed protein product [Coregonus sp. 'balchen']|nr:unnamed protein product [Coregonus sp. 'balchen']